MSHAEWDDVTIGCLIKLYCNCPVYFETVKDGEPGSGLIKYQDGEYVGLVVDQYVMHYKEGHKKLCLHVLVGEDVIFLAYLPRGCYLRLAAEAWEHRHDSPDRQE